MNKKRILSVRLIREVDTDADTSYLGEYSNTAASEYAIDRAHSADCASLFPTYDCPECGETFPDAKLYDMCPKCNGASLEDGGMGDCDCGGHNISSREYRYFNPPIENYKGESPEHIRNYSLEDYERMESLHAGDWCYIGIRAQAEIAMTNEGRNLPHLITQTITSGGLWGIESDSDESYLKEVESEQLAELKSQLRAIGFSTRAISKAFKSITEERP